MATPTHGETLVIRWPRWSLTGVCLAHAAVLIWAGWNLPWSDFGIFAVVATTLAALHLVTAVLAACKARGPLVPIWRGLAVVSLAVAVAAAAAMLHAAVRVSALYGSLGEGVASAIMATWGLVALLTVPIAWWGLALTWRPRGATRRKATGVAVVIPVLALAGAAAEATTGKEEATDDDPARVRSVLAAALDDTGAGPAHSAASSLHHTGAARCEAAPGDGGRTLLVSHRPEKRRAVQHTCLQAPSLQALSDALAELAERGDPGSPMVLDLVIATEELRAHHPLLDPLKLRPGLDGACVEGRCLAPWQLVATDTFTAHEPFPSVPEARLGFSAQRLRQQLGQPDADASVRGLTRIATWSFLAPGDGTLVPLRRLRPWPVEATPEAVRAGARLAEHHVAAAQLPTGVFRYMLDPFTGHTETASFNMARQAGTTLALCELAENRGRASRIARSSIDTMIRHERRGGHLSALAVPGDRHRLASSALPLAAMLTCRPLVGPRHDAIIGRLGELLLAMQRPDGSFYPEYSFDLEAPRGEGRAMFAEGQAVLALVLLAQLGEDATASVPNAQRLDRAIGRAMDHFAEAYWNHALREFFFIAENWHCLAARAALSSHRHDGYERFCLDYVRFQSRLVVDARDTQMPELDGGHGVGHVVPPHATSTAGVGEALAAAMAVKRARGLDTTDDAALMKRLLGFLLYNQWDAPSCFACTKRAFVLGAFSEHVASPHIRIDYVQHAWAALGHGGRMLATEGP